MLLMERRGEGYNDIEAPKVHATLSEDASLQTCIANDQLWHNNIIIYFLALFFVHFSKEFLTSVYLRLQL